MKDRERSTPLTPEFAFRAMKDRALYYHQLASNLDEQIKENRPDSARLREARTHIMNRAIGLTEAVGMLSGDNYKLPKGNTKVTNG